MLVDCQGNPNIRGPVSRGVAPGSKATSLTSLLRPLLNVQLMRRPCMQSTVTPLMLAARNGYADIVQVLLTHGANIQARDKVCSATLCWAPTAFECVVVDIQTQDAWACDCSGLIPWVLLQHLTTALHLVCRYSHYDVLCILLAHQPPPLLDPADKVRRPSKACLQSIVCTLACTQSALIGSPTFRRG